MRNKILREFFILIVLVGFLSPVLGADDIRTIPLDMYLVIDGSSSLEKSKGDIVRWINERFVDRVLVDGDRISVWVAGDTAQLLHENTISGSAGKNGIKDRLQNLNLGGKTADFSGALRDAAARVTQTAGNRDRISYTMLITASAEVLQPAMSGSSQGLLRWFRSERYERWQVLVVAPDIGNKVRQAAAAYMSSLR